jgi:hypothetical protein
MHNEKLPGNMMGDPFPVIPETLPFANVLCLAKATGTPFYPA